MWKVGGCFCSLSVCSLTYSMSGHGPLQVFTSLSDEERSKYVRFTWGRSRLPSGTSWSNRHTLQRRGGVADAQLPVAHTCFFSIELPAYSTEERMRWGILTAIHYGGAGILNA